MKYGCTLWQLVSVTSLRFCAFKSSTACSVPPLKRSADRLQPAGSDGSGLEVSNRLLVCSSFISTCLVLTSALMEISEHVKLHFLSRKTKFLLILQCF